MRLPAALLVGFVLLAPIQARAQQPAGASPSVTVVPAEARSITPATQFIGRVEAVQSVDLRARVEGFLTKVAFTEGQDVKAGDLLFQIDPAPYEAALTVAQAQLAQAKANLRQAQNNFERQAELARNRFQSQAVLDQAVAQRDVAAATVMAGEAAVRTAELNLGYTNIAAPIDGRVGKAAVTVGNLVNAATGALATLVQLDPIRVVFSVTDRDLINVRQRTGASQSDINALFVPSLVLGNGTTYDQPGRIDFVNNIVDPQTGTIAVRAVFPNPSKLLLPGLFVTIEVRPEQPERRILVPVAAVQEDKNGKFALAVDATSHVQERRITANRQLDQYWIVEQGLAEGENVIVEGLQKVRPGAVVSATPLPPAPAAPPAQAPAAAAPQVQTSPAATPTQSGR